MENSWHPIFLAVSVGFFSYVARIYVAWINHRPEMKIAIHHQKYIIPVTVVSGVMWVLFGIFFVISAPRKHGARVRETIGAFIVYMFLILMFIVLDRCNMLFNKPSQK